MKTKQHPFTAIVIVTILSMFIASCGKNNSIFSDNVAEDSGLTEINKQNTEKYVLIKTTLQELADLSGPIKMNQEGKNMSQAEELKTRIQMIRDRIKNLEELATDSTDAIAVKNLTILLQEKERQIRQLQKTISQQGTVIKQQDEDLRSANLRLQEQNNALLIKNEQLERSYKVIKNQQQKQADILYVVAQDYMRMGSFNFYKMEKSSSRALQWTCFNNAAIRFIDAQNISGNNYSSLINEAYRKRDEIKK